MSRSPLPRLHFLSPEWLEMARDALAAAIGADPGGARHRLLIEERLHAAPGGVRVLRIAVGEDGISLGLDVSDTRHPDLEIDCDWHDAHRAAAMTGGPALDAFNRLRIEEGRQTVRGSPAGLKAVLADAHDRIAARTLPPGNAGHRQWRET